MAVLGLIGLGFAVRMALKIKNEAAEGQDAKNRLQLVFAINTAALGTALIGLTLMAIGVFVA